MAAPLIVPSQDKRVCFDDDDDVIDEIKVVKATISQVLKVSSRQSSEGVPTNLNPNSIVELLDTLTKITTIS